MSAYSDGIDHLHKRAAIDAYLSFGLAEAKALIMQHRACGSGDCRSVDGRTHTEF
jgi:hypothetical protein